MSSGGDGYNFKRLKGAILSLSDSVDWEVAKKEWMLVGIDEAEEPETCLCGHHPIIEICALRNRVNGANAEVGNVCVEKFFGIRSGLIFDGIKRVRKDPDKSLNADCIAFFKARGILNNWEYQFASDTRLKRRLTEPQLRARHKINEKVLHAVAKRGFQRFVLGE